MPIRAAEGKPLTQAGRRMTAAENLLMEAGRNPEYLNLTPADKVRLLQEGRALSDAEIQLAYLAAAANSQTGKTLSDKDLKFHLDMIGRTPSDRDSGRTLSDLEYYMDLIGRTTSDRDMKVGKPGYNRRTIRRAGGGGIRSLKYNG